MSVGMEEEVSQLLTQLQPRYDLLLLMDIQFSSQQWKDLLLWRIQHALKSGQSKVC